MIINIYKFSKKFQCMILYIYIYSFMIILITLNIYIGGTSGIGKETVISLAKANYIIYIGNIMD